MACLKTQKASKRKKEPKPPEESSSRRWDEPHSIHRSKNGSLTAGH